MAPLLEALFDELLTGEVDDRARDGLRQVSPVWAVNIMVQMSQQRDLRNASGYIARGCRNADKPPGQREFQSVSKFLEDRGTLDTKAQQQICTCHPAVADKVLGSLLTMGEVRNPSAYVSKSIANEVAKGGGKGGGFAAAPPPYQAPPPAYHRDEPGVLAGPNSLPRVDWLKNWRTTLDESTCHRLEQAGQPVAAPILAELLNKMAATEIRNPSAYVIKALNNAGGGNYGGGGGYAPALADQGRKRGRDYGGDPLAQYRGVLDDNTLDALAGLDQGAAQDILQEFEKKRASVRNPSAYVMRSISNAKQGGAGARADGGQPAHKRPRLSAIDEITQPYRHLLDDRTITALGELAPDEARRILDEMAGKQAQGQLRNPSAYVMKSIGNSQKGLVFEGGQGRSGRGPALATGGPIMVEDFLVRWRSTLDQKTLDALEELGPDRCAPILADLWEKMQAGKVKNPSGYAWKAAQNDLSQGGPPPRAALQDHAVPDSPVAVGSDFLAEWRATLDERTCQALEDLGIDDASQILTEMWNKMQEPGRIKNPSAYITRSISNLKKTR